MDGLAAQYVLFLAEMATLVLAAIGLVAGLAALSRRKAKDTGHIKVTDINRQLEAAGDRIQAAQLPRKAHRTLQKQRKAERKARLKRTETEACSYLLDFKGDIRASALPPCARKSAPSCKWPSRVTRYCCGSKAAAAWSTATDLPPPSCCGCAMRSCR